MSFGFPASDTQQYNLGCPSDLLYQAVPMALNQLGWKWHNTTSSIFTASASFNLASYGEDITIDITHSPVVTVSSKCTFPLQCFDWGKNAKNVSAFFSSLNSQLQQFPANPSQ
jgi:hypothetical protein|tara:strand:+ start:305 stop:643 length:339 start_codon:yes stop_codon:yes gene_type:complete